MLRKVHAAVSSKFTLRLTTTLQMVSILAVDYLPWRTKTAEIVRRTNHRKELRQILWVKRSQTTES